MYNIFDAVVLRNPLFQFSGRMEELDKENAQNLGAKCVLGSRTRIADEEHCARYYQCTGGQIPVEMECPYPRLYSRESKKCEVYMFVKCDHRREPKDPCTYIKFSHACLLFWM